MNPIICVVDETGRDLAVADAVRKGQFTHAGVTLDLGTRPDWISGGLPADPEWRIEWVKLYEGLDLAHAYQLTGDRSYLDTWTGLVDSFREQVPVGHDTSDVSARRITNWLYAWQRFGRTPDDRLAARIRADADHLAGHLTAERNHRTLELYALLLVERALDADYRALDLLAANAAQDVWPDGVHRECSTDYHLIVLRSLLGAIANARGPVPDELTAAARRALTFAHAVQRPDGSTPALSDGDPGDYRAVLELGAELLGAPEPWTDFPVGGYHVQRAPDRWLVFDCGPIGDGGHGHYDQLSVEVAAGRPLLVDPGRYTYADGPDRRWFKGTAAHNTVSVDGLDQTPYRPGKPKGPTSTATFLGRWTAPGLDVLRGQVVSPCYDAVHTRTVVFVDDRFWVVHDRLRAPTVHTYTVRWQLAADDPGVTLLADGLEWTDGWVSPAYGIKERAPAGVLTATAKDADFVTTIVPA